MRRCFRCRWNPTPSFRLPSLKGQLALKPLDDVLVLRLRLVMICKSALEVLPL